MAARFRGRSVSRRLDTITLEQHLIEKHGLSRDTIRTFLSPVTGGGYGLGPDVLSGYCAYAPETQHPLDGDEEAGGQMFPGGNAGFARHIVKTLIPDSIEGPRTLEGVCRGRVSLRALDRPRQPTRIRLGATVGPQPPTISPDSPVILTLKVRYSYPGEPIEAQGTRGRMEMLTTAFREYERRIREQLTEMFARSGFDARRDVAGIILNRWGHAYVNPSRDSSSAPAAGPRRARCCAALPSAAWPSPTRTSSARWISATAFSRHSARWSRSSRAGSPARLQPPVEPA